VDDGTPGPGAVGAMATDITDRKTAEEEARRAVQARREVLSRLSRELRPALAAIEATSSTLLAGTTDREMARGLGEVVRSAREVTRLVADLLDPSGAARDSSPVGRSCIVQRALHRNAAQYWPS
jgi:signal transduction histidine kinase